jgi:hypothetical protein
MPEVRIDPIAPRHADAVQALASAPEVLATTNLPAPYPEDGAFRRVLDKLGFGAVGVETHEHPKWTADDPVVRYVLARNQWNEAPE